MLDAPNDRLLPILKIMELGRRVWEDVFLIPLRPLVSDALASLIEKERSTSEKERECTITKMIQAYKLSTPTLQIKAKHSTLRINAIEAFYRDNVASYCQQVMLSTDDAQFVNELSRIWGREVEMAERHLGSSVLVKATLKTHLIDRHLTRLLNLFKESVLKENDALIRDIYELMKQKRSLMEELDRALEQALIARASSLHTVIDFINEYMHCINLLTLLESHSGSIQARDRAFRNTLNRPEIRKKFPESLAHFIDKMLQEEGDLISSQVGITFTPSTHPPNVILHDSFDRVDIVLALFRLIEEKDIFQLLYTRLMTKRLVFNAASFHRQAEERMVLRLKDICGPGYVSPLARILSDSTISHQLSLQFCSASGRTSGCSFQVLAHGSWPVTSTTPSSQTQMPRIPQLQSILDEFTLSYTAMHQGRRLQWIPELGTADVQIEFGGTGKRYVFTVTMNQLAVLSCFKGTTPVSMHAIQQQSLLSDSTLKQVMDSLIQFKLFTFQSTDNTLCINERFKARHSRINLVPLSQSEGASQELLQEEVVMEEVGYTMDQRSNIIQAIIVKFMKQHKHCPHQALQSHVLNALASRFQVSEMEFNHSLTILLEKEYIAKCSEQEAQELMSIPPQVNKNHIAFEAGEAVYKYLP